MSEKDKSKAELIEELTFKNALLKAQTEASLDGILVVDGQGRVILSNRRFREMWKMPQEVAESRDGGEMCRYASTLMEEPDTFLTRVSYLQSHPDEDGWDELELADGGIFEEYSSALTDEAGQYHGRVWYFRDITDRKRAEELFSTVFYANPVATVITALADGRIRQVNDAFLQLLGYTRDEVVGRTIADLNVWPDEEQHVDAVAKVRGGGEIHNVEAAVQGKSGEIHHVLFSGVKAEIAGASYFFSMAVDITERKRLEEQLWQTQKMEAIGQLAGGVAHDFNNQLAGIMGYADILANDLEDEEQKGYAEAIVRAAKRSSDLTEQLLAFARKGKNLAVPVNVHSVIAEVVMLLEHSIDKRIAIRQHLDANPPMTTGDPTQLQNAFLNLAINARDAMPDGGELIFQTDVVALDEHYREKHAYAVAPGRYVRVCVTDTGVGMDEETRKRVFDPFFTTKELGRGTGMGLAAVYGAIKNHLGSVGVYSEAGHGTTFKVYLPLAESAADEEKGTAGVVPVKGTARILVVDDEEVARNVAASMLRGLGYKVAVCKNGADAVKYYRGAWRHVDLVILDMVMPEMGGRDTFIAMREINPDIRAVLSSGYSINGEAQSILDEGVLGFLQKPFQTVALSEAVAGALGHKG